MEQAEQSDWKSLHVMDASQEASTPLLSPLVSFFSCSVSCQICKLLLKVTQDFIQDQLVFKSRKKRKRIKPVSDDIGISTWEISSEKAGVKGESQATARPKQTMAMWTKQIKWSLEERVGVKGMNALIASPQSKSHYKLCKSPDWTCLYRHLEYSFWTPQCRATSIYPHKANQSPKVWWLNTSELNKHNVFHVQIWPEPNVVEFVQCFSSISLVHPLCLTVRKTYR